MKKKISVNRLGPKKEKKIIVSGACPRCKLRIYWDCARNPYRTVSRGVYCFRCMTPLKPMPTPIPQWATVRDEEPFVASELAMTLMNMGIDQGEKGLSTDHDALIRLWRERHCK